MKYPQLVVSLTNNFDAWIVGSVADPNNKSPRDYDVVVPHWEWDRAAHLIPKEIKSYANHPGCDTCDYGSFYGEDIRVVKPSLHKDLCFAIKEE